MGLGIKTAVKSSLRDIASLAYKKKCPVCGKRVRNFDPLPDFYLDSAKKYNFPHSYDLGETLNYKEYSCPNCGSSDRDRLYALYIGRNTSPEKKYKLLDIAPAKALRNFLKKKENVLYRSADLYNKDVDDTGVDITNMTNYPSETFDIFICSHVLEHVVDDRKAMRELYRVLKGGGFGIAMVPIVMGLKEIDEDPGLNDIAERWRRFGQDDHLRLYSKSAFTDRLRECGFTVGEVTQKDFAEGEFLKYGLSPTSVLYIVKK